MIRAVLDTNILVSALITKKYSPPFEIYQAFIMRKFLLVTSPSILSEVEDVINREKIVRLHGLTISQRQTLMEQLVTLSYVILDTIEKPKVLIERDPKDDKFLYAAQQGNVDYIVSGDNDLLSLHIYETIKIVTPNDFLMVL